MDSISVRVDGLDRLAQGLSPSKYRQAVRGLINKAGKQLDTHASRTLRTVYAIKASSYTKARRIVRSQGLPVYTITIKNNALPLSSFNAKQTRKGVTFRVRKDKGRQLLRSAFIYNGQVYRRKRSGTGLVPRYPIELQYGPKFSTMAETVNLKQALVEKGNAIIPAIFRHELEFRSS